MTFWKNLSKTNVISVSGCLYYRKKGICGHSPFVHCALGTIYDMVLEDP